MKKDTLTKKLLTCGLIAGPVYIGLGVLQGFIREGYDPTKHDLSLLSNGELGWIQITNFLVAGLLVILGAAGLKRAMKIGKGRVWGPLLLGLYGLGLIGAGVFVADPMLGFPPGTPEGMPKSISFNGLMHMMSGSLGFLGLIISCFIFARRFASFKKGSLAAYSVATGIIFLASFVGIASGTSSAVIVLAFTAAVILAWTWISVVSMLAKKGNI